MYNFTFHRPTTVRQAAGLLARNPEGKLLAGGHSLIPVMKLRLAQPSALIDLSLVEGMTGVEQKGRSIVIGAMTRHADVANATVLQQALPGLAAVPGAIGDPQVRNRGTIGGSIANNDPNADYPAACLGLGTAISLGLARFAYALLLPAMRADLGWSYLVAGAMNTVNAAGYLAGVMARRAVAKATA